MLRTDFLAVLVRRSTTQPEFTVYTSHGAFSFISVLGEERWKNSCSVLIASVFS